MHSLRARGSKLQVLDLFNITYVLDCIATTAPRLEGLGLEYYLSNRLNALNIEDRAIEDLAFILKLKKALPNLCHIILDSFERPLTFVVSTYTAGKGCGGTVKLERRLVSIQPQVSLVLRPTLLPPVIRTLS
ncbi:hypothetical protein BDK51DRAFT_31114 [Blyttiomyces helicus]|uniref:Uncharacterized protein n=1 Tax=Blyttiomyces helicus TaxID=388810 RepID=A0A4P9W4Z9_9FUNG|nr:hypothetical protein BDK51DRAFT_31114 [Blyttiomyces helicus]|eukprot:RKO86373.1 hypothetical protein BDK51DRAFT_31114 [Blyttiomyces helicus]